MASLFFETELFQIEFKRCYFLSNYFYVCYGVFDLKCFQQAKLGKTPD